MPESTMNLTFDEFLADVGDFLGYGRGAEFGDRAWDARKTRNIKLVAKSGLSKFYWPSLPPPQLTYEWSFLRPVATMTLEEAASTVTLPADFRGFEGRIVVSTDSATSWRPVNFFDETQVTYAFARSPDQTGPPIMASQRVLKGTTIDRSSRSELYVFPAADADYTLQFRYYLLPDMLTSTHPYAYGGAQHAETIKQSCLAVAERDIDDMMDGPHQQEFQRCLMTSIGLDSKNKPQTFGLNLDRSDVVVDRRGRRDYPVATWDGVVPDDF